MTDLKNLLDEAAGDEPALTEADLAADLRRGQTALRRRRFVGIVAGGAATALVVSGGWALLPDAVPFGAPADPGVAGRPTSTAKPTTKPTLGPEVEGLRKEGERLANEPTVPRPAKPVVLVPDGQVRPGTDLVCDLKPKGWTVKVWSQQGNESELIISDPNLKNPGKYNETSTRMRVRHAKFWRDEKGRMLVEKYPSTWDELPHVMAGQREAVVAPAKAPVSDGIRDLHMKMSGTKLIQVTADATGLGWDLPTLLRFAGSCHYK
jgi:hypothetical protein